MTEVEPYLSFPGTCEEALQFYERCLDGKITALHRYEGTPMDNPQLPANWKNKVMHATFDAGGTKFMASDTMPGQPAGGFSGFAMSVGIPKDTAKARKVFDALAQGGKVTMPLDKTFWAAQFGMLTDKFGVPWMVNCEE
jgi:PhnB protein